MKPIAIVTDIEGTTSSIRFVKDVLFVYAERFLPEFVRKHKEERDVARQLRSMSENTGIPQKNTEALIDQLRLWMHEDQKVTELKALQGMVWERGYQRGEYQAHVYADVPPKLQEWLDEGINLYVYSSGSEKAQRLFFRYSSCGDLRLMFAGYFDTTIGAKQEVQSYLNLAEQIALPPKDILFLSDIEGELDAAADAGLNTIWVVRPQEGTVAPKKTRHAIVNTFSEIEL
ncbi:acireductone synthase [Pseudohongiella acticola]|jgi:enolase-phosphatase E1|uniref:acireductone synthase n=1 Tax=Pseudohongiella acticola TaxID=1524254 RepID=UPI0030EED49F